MTDFINLSIFQKSKNSFEGQLPDEKTLRVIRMHWFALASEALMLLFAAIPLLGMLIASSYMPTQELSNFTLFIVAMFFLYWWYWLFFTATMYYLNVWIITDHRIISSQQISLFKRGVAELYLAKIQDISVNVEGIFQTFLDLGDLEVQSAAAEKKFKLTSIENPIEVKELIMKAYNDFARTHPKGTEEKTSI